MEQARRIGSRNGWSPEETGLLFEQAKLAIENGEPVRSVFDSIALKTGRKPNSIRNYYYLKLKEEGGGTRNSFEPFDDEEVKALMSAMLRGQANGLSVRGIAFEMGGGDKKRMLRYQNKYRSVVKSDPEYVKDIIKELEQNDIPCCDPFVKKRSRRSDLSKVINELKEALAGTGVEEDMLFSGLLSLAKAAKSGKNVNGILEENAELKRRLSDIHVLACDFSRRSGMEKISSLSDFVISVEECSR